MDFFNYKNGRLHAEGVALDTIADEVGTPFYVYSTATLSRHFNLFADALRGMNALVCFAVKANSNQAVISTLGQMGAGADVVSGGELARALKAGIKPHKIVFSGVGKTDAEIEAALNAQAAMGVTWAKVPGSSARLFDVVHMRGVFATRRGLVSADMHVALVVSRGWALSAERDSGTCLVEYENDPENAASVLGVYRHEQLR